MRSQRGRNRRCFRLESLEDRNAPSGGLSGGMGQVHDHQDMNRGPQQVAGDENHRGRPANQDRGQNDVVDNDPNDNDVVDNDPNDNDANEVVENHRGRGPGGPR
jgi:hypothetical protein